MKVSLHNQRAKDTAKHNSRKKKRKGYDNAKSPRNGHYDCYGCGSSYDAERRYYDDHYAEILKGLNARARKHGNTSRIKTMDEWRTSARSAPQEMIIQLGGIDDQPEDDAYLRAALNEVRAMFRAYGLDMISADIHNDEETPHLHIRWTGNDPETGKPNVSKCLESHGCNRPDMKKKSGKYNNAMMSFTSELRERLETLGDSMGYSIDRTRDSTARHVSVSDYKKAMDEKKAIEESVKSPLTPDVAIAALTHCFKGARAGEGVMAALSTIGKAYSGLSSKDPKENIAKGISYSFARSAKGRFVSRFRDTLADLMKERAEKVAKRPTLEVEAGELERQKQKQRQRQLSR